MPELDPEFFKLVVPFTVGSGSAYYLQTQMFPDPLVQEHPYLIPIVTGLAVTWIYYFSNNKTAGFGM